MRLFITQNHISDNTLKLDPETDHHLRQVIRLRKGDELELVIGEKQLKKIKIEAVEKGKINFSLLSESKIAPAKFSITLAQCLPKQGKFSDILKMCTEIGVSHFIPVISERTISKAEKTDRWKKVIESAAQQSRQVRIPTLSETTPIANLVEDEYDLKLVLWEQAATPLKSVLKAHQNPKRILLVVGPEGGLSQSDVESIKAVPVSLGESILRTEHAAFFASAQLLYAIS